MALESAIPAIHRPATCYRSDFVSCTAVLN